jgi:Mbeg1-like
MAMWSARVLSAGTAILVLLTYVGDGTPARAQMLGAADADTAAEVLPYAYMSGDAYDRSQGIYKGQVPAGWTNIGDWQTVLRAAKRVDLIDAAKYSGFYASVYRTRNGAIAIAYRGTLPNLGDVITDLQGWQAQTPNQFGLAKELAVQVKKLFPKSHIEVTGHSLGGALATYVGQQVPGVSKVVTFNAANFGILSAATRAGTNQINIVVPKDVIGDPRSALSPTGLGPLSGKTYTVESTTAASHTLAGIIGGLKNTQPSGKKPADMAPSGQLTSSEPTGGAGRTASQSNVPSAPLLSPRQQPASKPAQPPKSKTSPSPSIAMAPVAGPATTAYPPRSALAFARPGGISLSEAAAAAMPIDIDLDGVHYRDGKLIISGRKSTTHVLDAALVLTALRASCDAGDPYFSLDPDNGPAWSAEGHRASERLWEGVKRDVGWETPVKADRRSIRSRSLLVRTIWGRRDYPQLWESIASDYPNLKSRLVFRPAWLQQTRFGEILYKADVLLKEISSGVSVLESGALRAAKIDSYVSELARSNAQTLFAGLRDQKVETQWKGSRFWFDIAPRQFGTSSSLEPLLIRSPLDRDLFNTLKERKLVAIGPSPSRPAHHVVKDSDTLDLSNVFPTMFVRRHDISKGIDIPDDDAIMNSLSTDVNNNIETYVSAYRELQALTEVIRAYIAAVHVVKSNKNICGPLNGLPLLDGEKTTQPLPDYHPSEVMMSVQRYAYGTGQAVRTLSARATVLQGGVAIAGKQFYEASAIAVQTNVIRDFRRELALIPNTEAIKSSWEDNAGRQFIVLNLRDDKELAGKAQQSAQPASKTSSDIGGRNTITERPDGIEIENEPPAAQLPPRIKWFGR